jgi:lipid-A-disaccharide synthase
MTLVYLVAGEASGDALGGRLMAALKARRPELRFAGVGGPEMQRQGLTSLFPMSDLAVMGLLEVLPRLRLVRRRIMETVKDIATSRPAVVVTIDSPGFTFRVLKGLTGRGVPRVHYVAPQVWAWREGRVRHFPGLWERLLCLLPFEPAFFARHNLPATFVGHPVLESGADLGDATRFRQSFNIPAQAQVAILMPGSRRSEIRYLLPIMGAALQFVARERPDLVPVVAAAAPVAATVEAATSRWPIRPIVLTGTRDKHDAFAAGTVALAKSGTSTLELAMAGVPMVVTYRGHSVSAAIVRRMLKVPFASILNLIAGEAIVPELLQENCRPDKLAEALLGLLANPSAAAAQRAATRAILAELRPPEGLPSAAAAAAVLELLDQPGCQGSGT